MITSVMHYMPTYPDAPVKRETLALMTGRDDRSIRREIAQLKRKYPIVNVGGGYYLATDPDDPNLQHYINAEMHRAREIMRGVKAHKRLAKREQIDGQLSLFGA